MIYFLIGLSLGALLVYALIATLFIVRGNPLKKAEPENVRVGDEPILKLRAPVKYPLEECLEELKFGRTAEDQQMLRIFIEQLKFPPTPPVKKEETFLDRLNVEKAELNERHTKLDSFIKSEAFEKLPDEQRKLLIVQRGVMLQYLEILADRIRLLN